MIGSIDDRGRPLLRLRVNGRDDEILLLVDTGFNGSVLLSERDAVEWGVQVLSTERDAELGDRSVVRVKQGVVSLYWWGALKVINVEITTGLEGRVPRASRTEGEPAGLLGTYLITPDILEIDFGRRFLTIRQNADANLE